MLISIECMRRRYISAAGDGALGVNGYQDAITGETFPREYYLVRGEDTRRLGCRRSPADSGGGYFGDTSVGRCVEHVVSRGPAEWHFDPAAVAMEPFAPAAARPRL